MMKNLLGALSKFKPSEPIAPAQPASTSSTSKPSWRDNVAKDTTYLSSVGYRAIGLTLGVFLIWAIFFPISGAVVGLGKVISEGQNKVLQHPAGGVVQRLVASDGDFLDKGELIAVIEPSSAIAELAQLEALKESFRARKTRLVASKNGEHASQRQLGTLTEFSLRGVDPITVASSGSDIRKSAVFTEQMREFEAELERFNAESSALNNQLFAAESELRSVSKQLTQSEARLDLLEQQQSGLTSLANAGHVARNQLWENEATLLDVAGQVAAFEGQYSSLIGRIDELNDRIQSLSATRDLEVSRELTDVLTEMNSIEQRIGAAKQVVEYSELRAPVSGTLTNLSVNTIGGVLEPGGTLAEIVPEAQPLQIEVQIMPADITSVAVDQSANIVITAFNQRLQDPLEGQVAYVSADSVIDQNTGEPYFLARLNLSPESSGLSEVKSGMYAQVFIQTESRSFMSYLMQPITDSFRKAFREK